MLHMASGGWRRQDICGNLMLGYQRRKAGASLIIEKEKGPVNIFFPPIIIFV